jgi:hypothetical protein
LLAGHLLFFDFHEQITGAGLPAVGEIPEIHKVPPSRFEFYDFKGVSSADNAEIFIKHTERK